MTSNHLKISYHLNGVYRWIEKLHDSVPSKMENDRLVLKREFGTGSIRIIELQEGLALSFIDLKTKKTTELIRLPKKENSDFIMQFHFSEVSFPAEMNGEKVRFGIYDQGVQLSSSTVPASYTIKSGVPIKLVHLWIGRDWILRNVLDESNNLKDAIVKEDPILMFETIDYKISHLKTLKPSSKKIDLLSSIFNILAHVFRKFESRDYQNLSNITPKELSALNLVRDQIEISIPQSLNAETLAMRCNMSLSKFKSMFKEVFGLTPYQYHLQIKLDRAMQMVLSRKFSINEISVALGYHSHSNFCKAFKKMYGVLPKEVN